MESLAITPTPTPTSNQSTRSLAFDMAHWAAEKKALNLRIYQVSDECSYADHVLVCSGTSDRHVLAIAEFLREQSKKEGRLPLGVEGTTQGHWVLLDYGDVIAHVFYEPVRDYYELDRMWGHAPQVEIEGITASRQNLATIEDDDDDDDDDE